MRTLRSVTVTAAALVGITGCGGGGEKASTTTPSTAAELTTSSVETTTTTRVIDPALQGLLLTASDLPGFKEQASSGPDGGGDGFSTCDPAAFPGIAALESAPSIDGVTFERGPEGAVEVASGVASASPEDAEKVLTAFLDPKVASCFESDIRASVGKDLPAGVTVDIKTSASKATLAGIDQAVVVAIAATVKRPGGTKAIRADLAFLRKAGTVVYISYFGVGTAATAAERQRIVSIAAGKLAGPPAPTSTSTTAATRSSTTKRPGTTTTTRRASSTSTTRRTSRTTATTRV